VPALRIEKEFLFLQASYYWLLLSVWFQLSNAGRYPDVATSGGWA
jgi:hypothetical protein